MSDQEVQRKNALCDFLIQQGIVGQQDEVAVDFATTLTALAIELGRKDALACALGWHVALGQKDLPDEQAITLDLSWANAVGGERFATSWAWEQPTLAREIFLLRRAVSHEGFAQVLITLQCKCLNNLGNRLSVAGRLIEALECWRRTLELEPRFGMALCNRARAFATYAGAFQDNGVKALFLWMAHREATTALASNSIFTDPTDQRNRERTRELKEWIESVLDIQAIAALDDPLAWPDASATEEERLYRRWCLANRLYLNPANDLGSYTLASTDSMQLAAHVVRVDARDRFDSFFDQMKQEYVSARWLLYEGLTVKAPHFSDKDVFLQATEPPAALSLAVEKVKVAYRTSYSLFDKVGFFMNAYMGLGIPERQVSFRSLWRKGEKGPIRGEFDLTGNWGFCALYWLAKDFFEKENDDVAEPDARGLSDIRNHIEHKYLRVTLDDSPIAPPEDLASMVSRGQFEGKAMHLLKLARSALVYLSVGVEFEERRRQPGLGALPVEELALRPLLPDAGKI